MDLCCQMIGWQAQEICTSGRGREWAAGIGDKEGAEGEGSLGAGDEEWADISGVLVPSSLCTCVCMPPPEKWKRIRRFVARKRPTPIPYHLRVTAPSSFHGEPVPSCTCFLQSDCLSKNKIIKTQPWA